MMRIRAIKHILISIVIISSCNSAEKEIEPLINHKANDTIPQTGNANNSSLDTSLFISKLNEFIPTITSLNQSIHCRIDTIRPSDQRCEYYRELFITEGNSVFIYLFETGDYFKNIEVVWSQYKNVDSLEKAFINIDETANHLRGSEPCLTKTNDFVIRSNESIYWLNGACYYPYNNFIKIARHFEASLVNFNKVDSVKCRCGGANVTRE